MSFSTHYYAKYANCVKDEWITQLKKAIKNKNWEEIQTLLHKIENFDFSE